MSNFYGQKSIVKQALFNQVVGLVESFIPLPIPLTQIAGLVNQFFKPKFNFGAQLLIHPFSISKENLVFTRPIEAEVFGDLPAFDGKPQAVIASLPWVSVATSLYNLNRLPARVKGRAVSEINRGLPFSFNKTLTCESAKGCEERVETMARVLTDELTRKLLTPIERVGRVLEPLPEFIAQRILAINQATLKPELSRGKDEVIIGTRVQIPLSVFTEPAPLQASQDLLHFLGNNSSQSNLLLVGFGILALAALAKQL